jgi:hypothetical protein
MSSDQILYCSHVYTGPDRRKTKIRYVQPDPSTLVPLNELLGTGKQPANLSVAVIRQDPHVRLLKNNGCEAWMSSRIYLPVQTESSLHVDVLVACSAQGQTETEPDFPVALGRWIPRMSSPRTITVRERARPAPASSLVSTMDVYKSIRGAGRPPCLLLIELFRSICPRHSFDHTYLVPSEKRPGQERETSQRGWVFFKP